MRLGNHYREYGINYSHMQRREFNRPFWDALRAQLRRYASGIAPSHNPNTSTL